MIRVQCPKCATPFDVEDEMRGRQDRCPRCATPVPVPAKAADETPLVALQAIVVRVPLAQVDDERRPEFEQFLNAIASEVARANLFASTGAPANLTIPVTLNPGGRAAFSVLVEPSELMPDAATLARLLGMLFAVRAPQLQGHPAAATLIFAVRGGTQQSR